MRTLVARRYAKALFELLPGPPEKGAAREHLRELADQTFRSPEFRDLIHNPVFTATMREDVIEKIARHLDVSPHTKGLLGLLAKRNRLNLLNEIADAFGRLVDEAQGQTTIRLLTSHLWSDGERGELTRRLESVTGSRVTLEFAADPSLLGGMILQIGDKIYDGSLRGRLENLRSRLTQE